MYTYFQFCYKRQFEIGLRRLWAVIMFCGLFPRLHNYFLSPEVVDYVTCDKWLKLSVCVAFFEPPFGGIGDKHTRFFELIGDWLTSYLWLLNFSPTFTTEALLAETCRWRRFWTGWVTLTKILGWRRCQSPTVVDISRHPNIGSRFFHFAIMHGICICSGVKKMNC